ncbi:MAG: tetratricopeptide repeat protein, partial [Candidatus Cloacimonetes bacterium]|nr:tetratricopeptide repeat protein [Candidatus Cloacimonadota bacterium]
MRKILLILIIGLSCQFLPAGEREDLTFILGLYRDGNYQLASTEMVRFLDEYPESEKRSDVIFLLANSCLQTGDHQQARQHFLTLYKQPDIFPYLGEVVFGLGQAEYYLHNLSQAESFFQDFLKKYPRHQLRSQAYYFLGRINLEKDELAKAESNFRDAGKLGLDNRLQVARVELQLAKNKPAEARAIVLSLLESAPDDEYTAQSLLLYQKYNLEQGQIADIMATGFDQISRSSRYYPEYQLLLAIAHYQKGEYELALNRLQTLDSPLAKYYRGLCYFEINNWDAARPLFTSLLQAEDMKVRTNSSFYLIRMLPDQNQAVSRFREFIQANPGHPLLGAAHFQTGVLLFRLGRYQEAIVDFDTALQKGTDISSREKAVYLKAESQFLLGQGTPAYTSFQEYLKAFPQGIFADQALFKLGLYHYNRSEYPEAFSKFDQVVSSYPSSDKVGMCNFYQGEIFYRQEKYQEADRYFTQASLGNADQGYITLRRAQIRYLRKQYNEALELLRAVPDEQRYLYEKLLLEGNCQFALN